MQQGGGVGQIRQHAGGLVGGQLRLGKPAGSDRQRVGTDCLAAGDVTRRIPDDPYLVWTEIQAQVFPRPGQGDRPLMIAIGMIIGKGAELKVIPEIQVGEF